jgi:hypothetical protein
LKISNELIDILKNQGIKNISETIGVKNWSWRVRSEILYSHIFYV